MLVGGVQVPPEKIDSNPLGLLPSGALITGQLNARALFSTSLGGTTAAVVQQVLPLGRESNFDPARDVERVYAAVYAMQGADFCAVLQGNFDVASIARAAENRAPTASGSQLVRTFYGGYYIFTVANVGFVVLTPRTILSGDETGMRRALDRLRSGKITHELERWMAELLLDPKPAFALGGAIAKQGVGLAASEQVPFLSGVSRLRMLGNFQTPGINVVGTLDYGDADAANRGAASLVQMRELAALVTFLSPFGGAVPTNLDVRVNETQVSFASSLDTALVQFVLGAIGPIFRPAASGWVGR